MKNLKLISSITVLLFIGFITSCSTSDPAPASTPATTLPGVSSNDYWPTAINNVWNYSSNGTAQQPMKIISNDIGYFQFANFFGSSSSSGGISITAQGSIKKTNGVYYIKYGTFQITGSYNGTMTGFEAIILKDNLAVGGTWNSDYNQTTTYTSFPTPILSSTIFKGTIMEKDVSLVVNGVNYSNVIQVKIEQTSSSSGTVINVENRYWFSKNVGLIKYSSTSGGSTTTTTLSSYTLF
ncbi:MAG: hypothetical protein H7174_05380 [Flavobacterium sp.]|nr:hypothetical protein [Flavobacterium sp.]